MSESSLSQPSIQHARQIIRPAIAPTPVATSETLNKQWGFHVWLKLEMLHTTGSFKERGAYYKLTSLSEDERDRGVIAASAGNHAQALAYHANRLSVPCTIVMPEGAPLIKVRNTTAHGARVILHGRDYDESLAHARELAETEGQTFVHGFDDPWIIAGQGTAGLELLEQCPALDCVIVPVGGGGLIAGIAQAVKEHSPGVRVIGVQSKAVPSVRGALEAGQPHKVASASTIADGIAVREVGGLCLDAIRKYVDDVVEVGESAIAQAILLMLEQEKAVVEGAGAVGVAAIRSGLIEGLEGKNVAVVLSGGNIDVNRLSRIIEKGLVKDGRLVRLRVQVPDVPGQLAEILSRVARQRGNIMEVQHQRAFADTEIGQTDIELTLETRGRQHLADIIEDLRDCCLLVEKLT